VIDLLMGADCEREIVEGDLGRVRAASGLYHASAAGETTWFEFARAIFAEHSRRPGRAFAIPRVVAISTREYPTPARRPANSVLSNAKLGETFGVRLADWREGLRETISAFE
jgi:dTDP-4-dehydrorhamnose reductase